MLFWDKKDCIKLVKKWTKLRRPSTNSPLTVKKQLKNICTYLYQFTVKKQLRNYRQLTHPWHVTPVRPSRQSTTLTTLLRDTWPSAGFQVVKGWLVVQKQQNQEQLAHFREVLRPFRKWVAFGQLFGPKKTVCPRIGGHKVDPLRLADEQSELELYASCSPASSFRWPDFLAKNWE